LLNVEGVIGSYFADEYKGSDNPSQESFMGSRGADSIDGLGGYDEVEYGDDPGGVIVVLDKTIALTLATPFSSILSAHIDDASSDDWQGFAIDGWGDKDLLRGVEGIEGSHFNDLLIGTESSSRFDGRAGADTIYGGAGDDWIEYNQNEAGVVVDLGLGKATEDGSGSIDTFFSIENIEGGMGSDRLKGDDGSNILLGHAGADTLEGADGADTLWGGAGGDLLVGGSGSDVFWIDGANESYLGGTQPPPWDVIQDFASGTDKVRIESLGSLALGSSNSITITTPSFNLTDTTWEMAVQAITAAQVDTTNPLPRSSGSSVNAYWLKFENTATSNSQYEVYGSYLWVDSGDSSANLVIQFVGVQTLNSSDFVLGPPGGN
jgi:Ca2+-binding RTX toxin-like protein